MSNYTEEREKRVWEAVTAIEDCISRNLRDEVVDQLEQKTREKLFEGYVLKEHYDCLARKYDILKMSSNIQQQFIQEAW